MESSTRFRDLPLASFVERLASAEPVPGGGSAAAVGAALAAGLVAMVASLSTGREAYAAHGPLHERAMAEGRRLADTCLALADEDAAAYAAYAAALRLPRASDEEKAARTAAIRAAARGACEAPHRTAEACAEIAALAEALAGRSNRNASSDLAVAAMLAVAGVRAAAANVEVNLPAVGDEGWAAARRDAAEALVDRVTALAAAVEAVVASGEPREPLPRGGA